MRHKIINPETGRWVKRDGKIGRRLVRSGNVITNRKRYLKLTNLWNWWAQQNDKRRQKVARIWWDTRLNDPIFKKYPFYILDYEAALKKAHSISMKE